MEELSEISSDWWISSITQKKAAHHLQNRDTMEPTTPIQPVCWALAPQAQVPAKQPHLPSLY